MYNEYPLEWTDLFEKNVSTKAYEEIVSTTGFGYAQEKTEGSAIRYDDNRQGFIFTFRHTVLGLGFIITREMYEDGLAVTKSIAKAKALGFSMRVTKETRAANVYNRAFNSSYTFGDGKELCATDLPNKSGGTWANELTTAADLSEASLEQACLDIADFTDDRGKPIAVRPRTLIIPPELEFEAARILRSIQQSGTANNDINAIRVLGKFPGGVKVNHYLTDADAWFIRTDAPDGMLMFQRRPLEFKEDGDFDTENAKYKATERYSFGVADKRGIYGSPGA